MKNTLKIVLALSAALFLLTGCGMRNYVGLNVSKNKTVNLEIVSAMDDELIDSFIDSSSGSDVSGDIIDIDLGDQSGEENVTEYTEYEDLIQVNPSEEETEEVDEILDESGEEEILNFDLDVSGDDEPFDISSLFGGSSSGESKHTDEERWAYLESSESGDESFKDYKRTRYEEDGYKGFKYTKKLGKLDKLVTDDPSSVTSLSKIESGDTKFILKSGDVYIINIPVASTEDRTNAESYKQYGVDVDFKFYITLPNPAINNNASFVSEDKLTYTWDLLDTENIEIEFEVEKGFPVVPVLIGIFALIVVISIIGSTRKRKSE